MHQKNNDNDADPARCEVACPGADPDGRHRDTDVRPHYSEAMHTVIDELHGVATSEPAMPGDASHQ